MFVKLSWLAGATALAAAFFASPASAAPKACLANYHLDANGHCQPNNPLPQRNICPHGYWAHSAHNRRGYRCKPYP